MSEAPILVKWTGETFVPANPTMLSRAVKNYEQNELYRIEFREDRSGPSHRHYFSALSEAFNQLPEDFAQEFQSPEDLRAYALIKSGFADHVDVVMDDAKLAQRIAAFLARLRARYFKQYAIIVPRGTTVRIYTPKSQSYKAMDRRTFQASKEAVLGVIADLAGIDIKALSARAAEAPDDAHGRNSPDIPEHPQPESHRQTALSQDAPPAAVSGASPVNATSPELPVTGGASPEEKTGAGGDKPMPRTYNECLTYTRTWLSFVKSKDRILERIQRERKELWPKLAPPLTQGQHDYFLKIAMDAIDQLA